MDFITKLSRPVSLEEAISYLQASPLLTPEYKLTMPVVVPAPVGPDVTYAVAMNVLINYKETTLDVDHHPTFRGGLVISSLPVRVYNSRMTYQVARKERTDVIVRSFLVSPKQLVGVAKLVVRAHVSEALAYLYTEPSAVKQATPSTVLVSNFRSAKVRETMRAPMGEAPMTSPVGWMRGDAEKNRDNVYAATSSAHQMLGVQTLVLGCIEHACLKHFGAVIKTMTREITVPSPIPGYSHVSTQGNSSVYSMTQFMPPRIGWRAYDESYKYLSMMRELRGEDDKWLSPLTAGYYWASLPRNIVVTMWNLVDVLHMLRATEKSTVYYMDMPSSVISTSLVLNGYVVMVATVGLADKLIYKEIDEMTVIVPAVYRVHDLPEDISALIVCSSKLFQKPSVTKLGVKYPLVSESISQFEDTIRRYPTSEVMAHAFLTPKLGEEMDIVFIPSVHAHAGHVIITNARLVSFDPLVLLTRMSHANCIKTWFPFSRFRMLEYDYSYFKFYNLAFSASFMMSLLPIRAEKLDIFATAMTEQEYEDNIVPYDVGPVLDARLNEFYATAGFEAFNQPEIRPEPVVVIYPVPAPPPVVLPGVVPEDPLPPPVPPLPDGVVAPVVEIQLDQIFDNAIFG